MPVNSQDHGVGNEAAEGKGREWGDHEQPREGRMAQSHTPSTTNSRRAQPMLEWEEQAHTGPGETGLVTWSSRLAKEQFSPS